MESHRTSGKLGGNIVKYTSTDNKFLFLPRKDDA